MMMEKAFVFVVCGGKEHLDTLHFSLKSFREKVKYPIVVVTDTTRNETGILHDHIIDVRTPENLDHHQASIYLKTSLHRILPKGGRYVYMDTDILAVGEHVNEIFDQYIPPVRFALDHCKMPLFSPTAMNCSCKKEYDDTIQAIKNYVDSLDHYQFINDPEIIRQRETLKRRLVVVFNDKLKFLMKGTQGFFSWPVFNFDKDFKYNRKEKIWYNSKGQPIMAQVDWSKVAKKFDLKYDLLSMQIKNQKGHSIWVNQCDHLPEYIDRKFGIKVKNKNFHHWNGGVFLFDDRSYDFLEFWHQSTMEIFEDPDWRTRDQGTLIATVWKFSLQNHAPLDEKWNYICDYNNSLFGFRERDGALTKDQKKYTQPEFVHVYHHYGDTSWDFWNWITK